MILHSDVFMKHFYFWTVLLSPSLTKHTSIKTRSAHWASLWELLRTADAVIQTWKECNGESAPPIRDAHFYQWGKKRGESIKTVHVCMHSLFLVFTEKNKKCNQGWVTLSLHNLSLFPLGPMWKLYWTKSLLTSMSRSLPSPHKTQQALPPNPLSAVLALWRQILHVRLPLQSVITSHCVCMRCKYSQITQPSLPCPRQTAKRLHV